MNDRRTFLSASSAAAVHMLAGKASANDRVRVAVIGLNGRGKDHIKGWLAQPDVDLVALCDVDSKVLDARASELTAKVNRPVKTFTGMRKLFESKEVDAVSVATPNHWHSLGACPRIPEHRGNG
ncbi:MAG: hypothetical protein FJW39_20790 [Acidobacteria bacterium]|nr:hypothetical protein [Acidobacteriota bacterium]